MRFCSFPLWTIALAAAAQAGEVYVLHATADVTLRIPVRGAPRALIWTRNDRWEDANASVREGVMTIVAPVARIRGGRTRILIGDLPGVDINDRAAPALSLLLDGRPCAPSAKPLVLTRLPQRLLCVAEDAANRVDRESVRVCIDDRAVPLKLQNEEDRGRRLTFLAQLPPLEFGLHVFEAVAEDASPFRNKARRAWRVQLANAKDLAQASLGAKVLVDSCYPNYDPSPLIDGDFNSCANAGGPEVSWASAEVATDHWIVVRLPKPQPIGSVTLFWVRSHPSQHVLAQVRRGKRWVTVGEARPKGECASTTIRFPAQRAAEVRVLQPKGGGLPNRPHLLWVGEVWVSPP